MQMVADPPDRTRENGPSGASQGCVHDQRRKCEPLAPGRRASSSTGAAEFGAVRTANNCCGVKSVLPRNCGHPPSRPISWLYRSEGGVNRGAERPLTVILRLKIDAVHGLAPSI